MPDLSPPGVVAVYHERSKHRPQAWAAGPETLDWDAQPDPFRVYVGAPQWRLPLRVEGPDTAWSALFTPGAMSPQPITLDSLGLLFELSLALAAWKEAGPDRWSVRINPSSGNLHPTEGWLLARGLPELPDGLYHYMPREHALAQRAAARPVAAGSAPQAWLALSSLTWREAWKYGERAFRYCQLDLGHAIGALRFAAALLGWRLHEQAVPSAQLAGWLGLDREDLGRAERDEPECLLAITPQGQADAPLPADWLQQAHWQGVANRLDAHPMYRWPLIDEVAQATRSTKHPASGLAECDPAPQPVPPSPLATRAAERPAAALIRGRRSAQRFDARARCDSATLWALLDAVSPPHLPFEQFDARVHLLVFAHRVDGLAPGAYLLARSVDGEARLRQHLSDGLAWQRVTEAPASLRLWQLAENPSLAGTLRTLNCHQALGSDAIVGLALLAEFQPLNDASTYRERLREAGLLGQALYLAAEAQGLAGTGIGCFFDDELHQLVGLQWLQAEVAALQSVYHFTIGQAVPDPRIRTEPPYPPERQALPSGPVLAPAGAHHG